MTTLKLPFLFVDHIQEHHKNLVFHVGFFQFFLEDYLDHLLKLVLVQQYFPVLQFLVHQEVLHFLIHYYRDQPVVHAL